ncbi:MAG: hypothetical protein UHS50_07140, partial [Bacteroidaceae bacterium]|nr:hypothetical protein [Bacteroidaceae bacterium]
FGGIGVSENLGRCTQRPYSLTTHFSLLTTHRSWLIRVPQKIPHLLCGEGGSAMRIVPCIT